MASGEVATVGAGALAELPYGYAVTSSGRVSGVTEPGELSVHYPFTTKDLVVLDNALKYTKDNGVIELSISATKDKGIMKVIDNGVGIKEENLQNVFVRFFREDKARNRNSGGTGLGLSIAKWIADCHGGTITAQRGKEVGTIIEVQLPREFKNKNTKNASRA